MNFYNLISKFLLASVLICFLVMPAKVFAVNSDYQTFSEIETKKIFQTSIGRIGEEAQKLKGSPYASPEEITAMFFLREVVRADLWNYLFGDLSVEATINISKELVNIAKILNTENPVGGLIGLAESLTVKEAVKYANEYLFQYQMKAAFGAMKVKYTTGRAKVDSPLQYIMVYKPKDENKGELIIRLYSPKALEPPTSHGSIGMSMGFINDLSEGEKIPPFIAEIRGEVVKTNFPYDRQWTSSPTITIAFPDKVPDFNLTPKSWVDKYINDPINKTLKSAEDFINSIFPVKAKIVDYIPYTEETGNTSAINKEINKIGQGDVLVDSEPVKKEPKIIQTEKEIKDEAPKESKPKTIKEDKKEDNNNLIEGLSDEQKKKSLVRVMNELEKRLTEESKQNDEIQQSNEDNDPKSICEINNAALAKQDDVIINEVAWMGSKKSGNDEWIEFRNLSTKEINLNGWSLVSEDKKINISFEADHVVLPVGFFLLERTDDDSVPNKTADIIYSGILGNTNEALYLFNEKCELEDFVKAASDWPGGDNTTRRTMERNIADMGWHTYGGIEADIMGTPQEQNNETWWYKKTTAKTTAISGGGGGGGPAPSQSVDSNLNETITYCTQANLVAPTKSPIVINEVGWMGTPDSANDEWIELKNVGAEAVNLNGWQLLDKDDQIKISFSNIDSINPGEFYLLERTDDNSVPNITAGKVYAGALSNSSESLRLFNANCQLVDEVVAEAAWLAGNSTTKRSMERNNDLNGWHTFAELTADTVSTLYGTPKKENSIIVDESQDQQDEGQNDEEDNQEDPPPEDNPPVDESITSLSINDLKAEGDENTSNALVLLWTELAGAENYEIYYSIGESIDPSNLKSITDYEDIEITKDGTTAQVRLRDFYWGYDYYFAVKGKDSQGNYSLISNIAKSTIPIANHQRALGWGDNKRSGKLPFSGPTGEIEANIFASEQDGDLTNDDVSAPPIIDNNGSIYFTANFDGNQGLYAYDDVGLRWFYKLDSFSYNPVVMGRDGTIYFIDKGSVYSVTPSGKLKWKKSLHGIYTTSVAINSIGEIYIIGANDANQPILVKITDEIDKANQEEVCNLGASVGAVPPDKVSEIIFDSADNLYFSINNSLFAFSKDGNRLIERKIDIIYSDGYQKSGTEINYIDQPYLSPDQSMLVFNVRGGFYDTNGQRTVVYAFNAGDINGGEPVWKRQFGELGNIMGVGDNNLYFKETVKDGWGNDCCSAIHGINFNDGTDSWVKRENDPYSISDLNIDINNNIYFYQRACIYGFDTIALSLEDSLWETGEIFYSCRNGQPTRTPLSMGNGVMYIPTRSKILKATY